MAGVGGKRLVDAVARKLPRDARCTLSLFSLSSLWVLRSGDEREGGWWGGGGGDDRLANPTSPVDREQMGPDSLLTNHCQRHFGLLL